MRLAALHEQKSLRDLAGLPRLCDTVDWCDVEALATATDPALIAGLWLFDEPGLARKLLDARSTAGLTTIIVPRFKAGDLRVVLKAPTTVRLKPGEYESFQWDDASGVNLGGQTLIETTLHRGQWGAVAGMGETVLAYRAHEAAGWTVLCTAAVTSKQFGVDMEAQRWLLAEIIRRTSSMAPAPMNDNAPSVQPARTIQEFLESGDANAPAVALAVALNDGDRHVEIVSKTLDSMGFTLCTEEIQNSLSRMPDETTARLEQALRQSGWGAYLRRGQRLLAERGVE